MEGWQVFTLISTRPLTLYAVEHVNKRLSSDYDVAISLYCSACLGSTYCSLVAVPVALGCNRAALYDAFDMLSCGAYAYRHVASCPNNPFTF